MQKLVCLLEVKSLCILSDYEANRANKIDRFIYKMMLINYRAGSGQLKIKLNCSGHGVDMKKST